MLVLLLLTGFSALVIAWCVQDIVRERNAPLLDPRPDLPAGGPLVSVLIPARNEAARIEPCLNGLAAQSYHNFETIVVDDHSSDGTAEVVAAYTRRIPELSIVSSAALPAGWAGKCWACWQAAGRARGEWLLFLDADVIPRPALLAALVDRAMRDHLDLLTLMPLLKLESFAERTVLPAFMSLLYALYPLDRVSAPRSRLAFANGQCLLVRRTVYERLDGHRAVRASILEDTHFGQLARAGGYRIVAAAAPDLIAVRMYTGWRTLAEGLEKNAVAGFHSGGARSAWVGMRQALIAFLPWHLLIVGMLALAWPPTAFLARPLLALGALAALVALVAWGWLARRRYRIGAGWGALLPLGMAIYFGLSARAFVRLRRGRGVAWKGRRFG